MRRLVIVLFVCCAATATAATAPSVKNKHSAGSKTTVNFAVRIVQGFNMRVWLSNQITMGLEAWDVFTSGGSIPVPPYYGMEYPTGSGIEHLYGAGPLIGGIVKGVRRVSEAYNTEDAHKELLPEYRHIHREHFWRTSVGASERAIAPDSIGYSGYYYNHKTIVDRRGCDDDNDGKVDEDDLDGVDNDGDWNPLTDDVGSDGLPDSLEVSCDGIPYDPVANPDPAGDDYNPVARDKCHPNPDGSLPLKNNPDVWSEKNGMPDHGEPHVDEDYGAVSENDLYCSAIDTFRTPVIAGHVPMGIKVVQKSYAWGGSFAEGVLPFDYYFINVGRNEINDVWVGFLGDMDVGPTNVPSYQLNNYAAYMDSLRTAFVHNPLDRGSTPIGLTALAAPRPLDSLTYVFQWYDYSTRPGPGTNDSMIYSWMCGEHFPNNLIAANQSPELLSDDRLLFSFGPFATLRPRDTLKISVAITSGFGVAQGVNNLMENAQKALKLYNRGYIPPVVPPSPSLRITPGFRSDTLRWGGSVGSIDPFKVWDDSNKLAQSYPPDHWRRRNPPCGEGSTACSGHKCDEHGNLPGGRIFSGYNLYRSEDPGASPLATSFTLLKQFVYPEDSVKAKEAEWDSVFVDSNLVRGKRYWYAVTSFGLPDMAIIPVPLPGGVVRYDTLFTGNSESSIYENATKVDLEFSPSKQLGEVLVVPNPYRVDNDYTFESGGWEGRARDWTENERRVKFIHLPEGEWTIRVFSLSGDLITTIRNTPDDPAYSDKKGEISWNLLSESNRALASGVYVFSVESKVGRQIGKFVLIR